jgi:hypothetical protein
MLRTARLSTLVTAGAFVAMSCVGAVTQGEPQPSPSSGAEPPRRGAPASPSDRASPDLSSLRVSTTGWRTDFSRASVDLGELMSGGPPKDGIPSIDSPRFESLDAARAWLADQSPVIALEIGGQARAYPLAILTWHEIVNDALGGEPVVVTFCPLCNTALVFERTLEGRVLDFGTTGNLRFSDLVMYDRQTESWWQQATGEAIVGELTGERLTFLPAQIVSLADFSAAYPAGDVLSRETGHPRRYGQNPYPGYDRADEQPFLYDGVVDGRLAPKERVVTVGQGKDAVAFPFIELAKVGVVNEVVAGEPVVVFWAPGTASALDAASVDEGRDAGATGVFRPIAEGRMLTFERRGGAGAAITDRETGSSWSITGRATDGPLRGSTLESVVHGDHFWFAWAAFQPQTRIWTAP